MAQPGAVPHNLPEAEADHEGRPAKMPGGSEVFLGAPRGRRSHEGIQPLDKSGPSPYTACQRRVASGPDPRGPGGAGQRREPTVELFLLPSDNPRARFPSPPAPAGQGKMGPRCVCGLSWIGWGADPAEIVRGPVSFHSHFALFLSVLSWGRLASAQPEGGGNLPYCLESLPRCATAWNARRDGP